MGNTLINTLSPYTLGPFQFLPIYYWIALSLLIIFILISIQNENFHFKYTSLFMLCLFTIASIAIIEPYGRGYPDVYVNVNLGTLILQYGNINFGAQYPSIYPSFFLFVGILQQIINVANGTIVRFFSWFMLLGYLSGLILLINSIIDLFNISKNEKKPVIILTVLFFTIFSFSLGVRTDPSPQSLAIIFMLYFVATFIREITREDYKWIIISLIFLTVFVACHLITPLLAILLVTWVLLFTKFFNLTNNKRIGKILLPLVVWFSWATYVGLDQLRTGINYINGLGITELNFEKGSRGISMPGSEIYGNFKIASILFIGYFLCISLIYLLKRKTKLAIFLCGLIAISSIPVASYFSDSADFLTRVIDFSSIFISLIFGFGMNIIFNEFNYMKNLAFNNKNLNLSLFLRILIIIILILASTTAILTTKKVDISTGTTMTEITGFEFLFDRSTGYILYPTEPQIQKSVNNYSDLNRVVRAWDDNYKGNAFQLEDFNGFIPITEQWKIRQQTIEGNLVTTLNEAENKINENNKTQKIYDNGGCNTYLN